MKVVLIPNPTPEDGVPEAHLPVGILCVATVLSNAGVDVKILDVNAIASDETYQEIPDAIVAEDPDIVGFSTMCTQYPMIVRWARQCRELRPGLKIIFGGPQATLSDRATLEAFPFVDLIVRGESELTILPVVKALSGHGDLHNVPGVTFRSPQGIVRTPSPPLIRDLDSLPDPRYDLFPSMHLLKNIFVEEGRGCPFDCSFCCTNRFWRRTFRVRSVDHVIGLIKKLKAEYGIKRFTFLHDIFTLSRQRVVQFCQAVKRENLDIQWGCSSRIDCVDEDLLRQMAEAGCASIYFGIESGSGRMQKSIGKNLNLSRAIEIARYTTELGMHYTASFIMGFPDERPEDLEQTINLMMKLKYMPGKVQDIQYHRLYVVPGSRLFQEGRQVLQFDGDFSGFARRRLCKEDFELVREYPEVFSAYHYLPTRYLDRALVVRLHFVVANLLLWMPYSGFVLHKDKDLAFPRCVMQHYQTVDFGQESSYGAHESLAKVCGFLDSIIAHRLGRVDHPIREVMRYELAVDRVKKSKENEGAMQVEEFSFEVEEYTDAIEANGFTRLPEIVRNGRFTLMFTKRDGKVVTVRLPAGVRRWINKGHSALSC